MAEIQPPPPLPQPFTYCDPAKTPVLLAQGAEARLYKTYFLDPSIPAALKVRPLKPYRHPILDRRLTRQRILQEARCMTKLVRDGVPVPGILAADWGQSSDLDSERKGESSANNGGWLLMEWIDGEVVRQVVNSWERWMKSSEALEEREPADTDMSSKMEAIKKSEEKVCALLRKIGSAVGMLHKTGIIHGDLTTSNLMLRRDDGASTETVSQEADTKKMEPGTEPPSLDGEIVLIDFGLASQSIQDEDRAVDLYVLERAFASSHPRTEGLFKEVLEGYGDSFKGAKQVLKRLEEVRMRGRKRSMIG
ncbi:serine/threonine-protein kinase bud32 [Microsporum canis]|uniref:EKC/KEOPS complex subunit BUD32 n=1 Tax=Arthroderma otae (strain ATCC MYA-4605 / CBS 113480) TaxID=554155 RepID=C5FBT3_ARTOC|nr:serine/threonine-protein kinase bud32 [Microsporum canis CBS 113480]EEQ27267.1 serine/threonine-protein kinase bud32 [Microsporum canis CBS 113480]